MPRPTFEELRARAGEKPWLTIYAGEPGTGPKEATCHDCAFLRYTGQARPTVMSDFPARMNSCLGPPSPDGHDNWIVICKERIVAVDGF